MVEQGQLAREGFRARIAVRSRGGLGLSAQHLRQDTVGFTLMYSASLVRELGKHGNLYDRERKKKRLSVAIACGEIGDI